MATFSKSLLIIFLTISLFSCSTENKEFQKGKLAFEENDYNTSIKHFKKVIKENYKNAEAYVFLGKAYLRLEGDYYNTAIDYLNKALKYQPDNPETYVYLGDAYQDKYSKQIGYNEFFRIIDEGKYPASDDAIIYYQKAININPKYALSYYKMGTMYGFNKNEIEEGINWFKKGIAIDDNYTHVYLNLGELYSKRMEYDTALFYFKKEISFNPNILESYYKISVNLIHLNKSDEAINYLNILSQKDPNYNGLNYLLGIAYSEIDKLKSVEFMKTAARLNDANAKDWLSKRKIKW